MPHLERSLFLAIGLLLVTFSTVACDSHAEDMANSDKIAMPGGAMEDKPIKAFQIELLNLAFETATAIPVEPHIKDRSLAQQRVIETYLKLDQPQTALSHFDQIENWRRGVCYADLAFYCAQHDDVVAANNFLKEAEEISNTTEDWRRDTIRVKIAKTHAILGRTGEAERFASGVVPSETGKIDQAKAMVADTESFDTQLKSLDGLIEVGDFDILRNALDSFAQLFDQFYDNPSMMTEAEERIKKSWDPLPIFLRIGLLNKLAGIALDHEDRDKALALVNESQQMFEEHYFSLEDSMPLASKIAELRFRAGDTEKAMADAGNLLARFHEDGDAIVDIWRAKALRPLAEAYQAMGDTQAARGVYRLALEEGSKNPNARPRAEDLSATCRSMALCGVEPDSALWSDIRKIREELHAPW